MKVNMTPNPLDVVTIHASQGDTEARQWEFELHNNGELIDTSDVKEQMFFKAYKGGTEQLLPENGSTPTTSPFKGDIKYPQGLLTDQEFLYRESPTEEDGLAKITDIKGNTLVWNQLNASSRSTSTDNGITFTKNADGSWTVNGTATADAEKYPSGSGQAGIVVGHKYLMQGCPSGGSNSTYYMAVAGSSILDIGNGIIISALATYGMRIIVKNGTQVNNLVFRPQLFDLTQMFGSAKADEIYAMETAQAGSGVAYFRSLFPLPYYQYDAGSLLSFNGTGIKTVGKNQFNAEAIVTSSGHSSYVYIQDGYLMFSTGDISTQGFHWDNLNLPCPLYFKGSAKNFATSANAIRIIFDLSDGTTDVVSFPTSVPANEEVSFSKVIGASGKKVIRIRNAWTDNKQTGINLSTTQLEFGTTPTEYAPYTSSTLSLPISTYFPNGMDGVGTAYDELTPSKATTRMDRIDLGSITYSRVQSQTSDVYFFVGTFNSIPNIKTKTNYEVWNIKTPLYETVASASIYQGTAQNKTIGGYDGKTVRIRDDSFTDATAFKNSLSGQYLVYELATPTETSFTTASLVTENAEIPLSNEDGVLIGKCTEQLSENPGFIDAKIKLSDSDGTCYSNKLQLHVERSPQ